MSDNDPSIRAGKISRAVARSLRPIRPRTACPSAPAAPPRSAAQAICSRWGRFQEQPSQPLSAPMLALNVEPWSDPYVFDVERVPKQDFDRQANHCQKEEHHERVLQQALALVVLGVVAAVQRVRHESCHKVVASNNDRSKNAFRRVGSNAEQV